VNKIQKRRTLVRIVRNLAGTLLAVALVLFAVGYRKATMAPLVRHLTLVTPDYPKGVPPTRIVLLSDIHVQGPDMPPDRVDRIVDQINSLHPDIAVIAGDFVGNTRLGAAYSPEDTAKPLRRLNPRLGTYAVLGNNDSNVTSHLLPALRRAGVRVLSNEAARAGPLAIGGIDGRLVHSPTELEVARRAAYRALAVTPGVKILIAHDPDEFAAAPAFVSLVLAGHTHCGQIVLPVLGALATGPEYGTRFLCGVYRDSSKLLVVSGGLGTSHLPLRLGAPADVWLISITGASAK
jgi:predicted MPP superfamily phosphohydrolase